MTDTAAPLAGSVSGEAAAGVVQYGGAHECTEALVAAGLSPDIAGVVSVAFFVVLRLALDEWRDWRRQRRTHRAATTPRATFVSDAPVNIRTERGGNDG